MVWKASTLILWLTRAVMAAEILLGLLQGRWAPGAVAAAGLALTFAPVPAAAAVGLRLPTSFVAAIALFVFATLCLGEGQDFYNRFWWWDVPLHFGAALGFGLAGFLLMLMLFDGDRAAAPPRAVWFLSFCTSCTMGALWEIFEFGMDQVFGMNMQKSGLMDTMTDLIVNALGAAIAASAGVRHLDGRGIAPFRQAIDGFIALNPRRFRRYRPPA